jgi:hypothetical protein
VITASGLMLLACSWFVLGTGSFGISRDVGGPDPVRIDGATAPRPAASQTPGVTPSADRFDRPGRDSNRSEPATARSVRHPDEHAPQGAAATGPAPVRSGPAPPAAPSTNQTVQEPSLPAVETTLPPPLDQVVQTPPLPSVPALPLPEVSTGSVTVGVP